MARRVLIVAPHFAPVNAPDGHRARLLLPWLGEFGWEPTILAVRPEFVDAPVEPALLETIPSGIQIVRTEAWRSARSRRFGVGNLGWRALPWLGREGARLLRTGRFDLVYFSTTQFACLPLGRRWLRAFGVPYLIDLQDPWHNVYYARPGAPRPPGGWKYRCASLTTRLLEGWTLRRCRHVIAVSERYLEDLQQRRPWFDRSRGSVIPFGWSERDQAAARQFGTDRRPAEPEIRYFGRVGDDMAGLLRLLLGEFATWRASRPAAPRLHWRFVGTSYGGRTGRGGVPAQLAGELRLQDVVSEDPMRQGYLAAIAAQQRSGANLILGSDDHGYSPSKLWPTLAGGRPWLAIVAEDSVLATWLRPHASAGLVLTAAGDRLTPEHRSRFHRFLDELGSGTLRPLPPAAGLAEFHADRLAQRHAAIFHAAASR